MSLSVPAVLLLLTNRLLEDVAEMASAAPAADSRACHRRSWWPQLPAAAPAAPRRRRFTAPDVTQGLRLFASRDEEAVFAFQREAWPKQPAALIPSRWRWMFLDSAARLGREPQVWLYWHDGEVVGHDGAIPVTLKMGGEERPTAWLVDTMVLEAYRTQAVGTG